MDVDKCMFNKPCVTCPTAFSLNDLECKDICPPCWTTLEPIPKRRKSAMNGANAYLTVNAPAPQTTASTEAEQRQYLTNRLYEIQDKKDDQLRKDFGLTDDDPPKTPQEYVDRIKKGHFVFRDPQHASDPLAWAYSNPARDIRWRDPSKKEDSAGYLVAQETMYQERRKLNDTVVIDTPQAALAAVQAWEDQ